MTPDLTAVVFGLLSAVAWGAGDFSGGLASRRAAVVGVLAVGQAAGVAMVVGLALATHEPFPPAGALLWAAGAGASGAVGLAALYRGLAVGRMGIVAPVSAVLSAGIPVLVGAASQGLPPAARLAGFALGLGGIFVLARSEQTRGDARGFLLAWVAGCGFGGFLVLQHQASASGTFWPLAAARATSFVLILATALLRRGAWVPQVRALPLIVASGLLDGAGNALFVVAAKVGRLDVAGVLSSMYPASTVLLAAVVLRERITARQLLGIAAVLAAIALIAA
ncbi:MAG: DMT family transporter [Anaeromyxobacter sp.]